jgi:hypothetical protein
MSKKTMKTSRIAHLTSQIAGKILFGGLISLVSLGTANSAQAALTTGVSSFTGGSPIFNSATRGFRFQATQNLTVTALGVFDIDSDGLTIPLSKTGVDVGLWNDSGTLLAQVSVPGGTTASILDGFRYANLTTSINLTSNSFYRVGADMSDISDDPDTIANATAGTLNGIGSVQSARNSITDGLAFPGDLVGEPGEVQLGGNILFDNSSTSVPFEFSPTLGFLLVGGLFASLKVYRRYQNNNILN